jgi:hypothetical protein
MEEDVTTALRGVREKAERKRRMQFAGAAVAAAALFATGVLAGPSILDAMRGTDPDPGIPIGGDESPSPSPSPEPTPILEPTPTEADESTGTFETRTVWLTSGEYLQSTAIEVPVPVQTSVAAATIDSLLTGANPPEVALGFGTAIPVGTKLLGLTIDEGVAVVNLNSAFDDGGGSLSMRMRVAQIVWTLRDEAPDGVIFHMNGQPVEALGGEGIVLEGPQLAADYEDLLAPITVSWPYPGATLTDLDIISGTANVFEATVTYRVLDAQGNSVLVNRKRKPVEEWFTTATCGTGCRGTWKARIDIDLDQIQEGTLEVYEVSAENGEPINMVRIPVTLDPSADGN